VLRQGSGEDRQVEPGVEDRMAVPVEAAEAEAAHPQAARRESPRSRSRERPAPSIGQVLAHGGHERRRHRQGLAGLEAERRLVLPDQHAVDGRLERELPRVRDPADPRRLDHGGVEAEANLLHRAGIGVVRCADRVPRRRARGEDGRPLAVDGGRSRPEDESGVQEEERERDEGEVLQADARHDVTFSPEDGVGPTGGTVHCRCPVNPPACAGRSRLR
jgi:hypothetical protein